MVGVFFELLEVLAELGLTVVGGTEDMPEVNRRVLLQLWGDGARAQWSVYFCRVKLIDPERKQHIYRICCYLFNLDGNIFGDRYFTEDRLWFVVSISVP
jgi:hypothetical protein